MSGHPVVLRLLAKRVAARNTCRPHESESEVEDREESPEPPDNNPSVKDSPLVIKPTGGVGRSDLTVLSAKSSSRPAADSQQRHEVSLPYCTLTCLHKLSNSEPLDSHCPNYLVHSSQPRLNPHTFLFLLRPQ